MTIINSETNYMLHRNLVAGQDYAPCTYVFLVITNQTISLTKDGTSSFKLATVRSSIMKVNSYGLLSRERFVNEPNPR